MSQEASKDNEISQDFEELVKNKEESATNKSESEASLSANSPEDEDDDDNEEQMQKQKIQQQQMQQQQMQQIQQQQMQQQMQQKMFQEQQMQQKMFQEQQKMQHKVLPKIVSNHHRRDSASDDKDVKKNNVKKVESKNIENFSNEKSLNKVLTTLGILFALFFVFSSSQLEGALGGVSYINNLPFPGQINLVIRALLFIIVYFLLDYFVL
jgi:Fe2+ transport system protein B